jgi:hypothetical protein
LGWNLRSSCLHLPNSWKYRHGPARPACLASFALILSQGTVEFYLMWDDTIALTAKRMCACRMAGLGGSCPSFHLFNKQSTHEPLIHKALNNPHKRSLSLSLFLSLEYWLPGSFKSGRSPNVRAKSLPENRKIFTKNSNTD